MNLQIANRLLQLRKERGLSQEELADQLGISRQAVSKWERAEASPDTDNLICLAKLYNVSLDYLLQSEDSIETIKTEQIKKEEVKIVVDEDEDAKKPKVLNMLSGLIPILVTITYLILGGVFNLWHPGWIVFLFIPVLLSLIDAIYFKRPNDFCFPVVVVIAYLFIGFEFSGWHPYWFLFLLIPVYYIICDAFNKNNDEEEAD